MLTCRQIVMVWNVFANLLKKEVSHKNSRCLLSLESWEALHCSYWAWHSGQEPVVAAGGGSPCWACTLPSAQPPLLLQGPAWLPKPTELARLVACVGYWFATPLHWLLRQGLGLSGYVFWMLQCFGGYLVGQSHGDEGSCNVRDRAIPGRIFLMCCIFRHPFRYSCGWNTCL